MVLHKAALCKLSNHIFLYTSIRSPDTGMSQRILGRWAGHCRTGLRTSGDEGHDEAAVAADLRVAVAVLGVLPADARVLLVHAHRLLHRPRLAWRQSKDKI